MASNTGYKRSLTLEINKTVAGETVAGYPITYNGLAAFPPSNPTFAAITATEMAEMTEADFNTRADAFKAYVESVEAGLDIDDVATNEARVYDDTMCTLPY